MVLQSDQKAKFLKEKNMITVMTKEEFVAMIEGEQENILYWRSRRLLRDKAGIAQFVCAIAYNQTTKNSWLLLSGKPQWVILADIGQIGPIDGCAIINAVADYEFVYRGYSVLVSLDSFAEITKLPLTIMIEKEDTLRVSDLDYLANICEAACLAKKDKKTIVFVQTDKTISIADEYCVTQFDLAELQSAIAATVAQYIASKM
jgi:hypothetical protein